MTWSHSRGACEGVLGLHDLAALGLQELAVPLEPLAPAGLVLGIRAGAPARPLLHILQLLLQEMVAGVGLVELVGQGLDGLLVLGELVLEGALLSASFDFF